MASGSFIAYYRVSTQKQGDSGLGLEAQQAAVRGYLNGGQWTLAGEYTETESGKINDRPQLLAALRQCKLTGSTLIAAKLDRLSRNSAFLNNLLESGAKFVAADMPEANALTIRILAAVAQVEREAISSRTKEALAAAKARGVKLGRPGGWAGLPRNTDVKKAQEARLAAVEQWRRDILPVVERLQREGGRSLREVAAGLDRLGVKTRTGGKWSAVAVKRLLDAG